MADQLRILLPLVFVICLLAPLYLGFALIQDTTPTTVMVAGLPESKDGVNQTYLIDEVLKDAADRGAALVIFLAEGNVADLRPAQRANQIGELELADRGPSPGYLVVEVSQGYDEVLKALPPDVRVLGTNNTVIHAGRRPINVGLLTSWTLVCLLLGAVTSTLVRGRLVHPRIALHAANHGSPSAAQTPPRRHPQAGQVGTFDSAPLEPHAVTSDTATAKGQIRVFPPSMRSSEAIFRDYTSKPRGVDPVDRQCGRCGSFKLRRPTAPANSDEYQCTACGHTFVDDAEAWPDVVVLPRIQTQGTS